MLRRRAGTVEGRDRWGAAEELLLFQRGFGYREPRYPSPLFSTERKDCDRRGRAGDWHLPPPPYLAICAVSVPNGGIERWICVRETGGGWDEQVYIQHVRSFITVTQRDAALGYYSSGWCLFGIAWTFVDTKCSLCLLKLWFLISLNLHIMCISLLYSIVLSRVA